jgi:hypothetical protein
MLFLVFAVVVIHLMICRHASAICMVVSVVESGLLHFDLRNKIFLNLRGVPNVYHKNALKYDSSYPLYQ